MNPNQYNFRSPLIKVVGVGGGGGNVINRMIEEGVDGVDYCVINTDVAVLRDSVSPTKIAIGRKLTNGQGAGMVPEIGKKAALENEKEIEAYLREADMVFIAAGMGGGTGTGAAPVIAEIAKELGILTVGVVTTPFKFEGRKRLKIAVSGVEELRKHTDTLMTVPNDRLLEIADNDNKNMTVLESFQLADDVLKQAISGLSMLINRNGVINLDFADVKTVMSNKGRAIIGIGHGVGEGRGLTAAKRAIQSPILNDVNIKGATGVIINFVADKNFTLKDAESAAGYIENYGTEDASVIFGLVYDDTKNNEVSVTVIATGFEGSSLVLPTDKKILPTKTDKTDEDSPWTNIIPMPAKPSRAEKTPDTKTNPDELAQDPAISKSNKPNVEEGMVELELKKIHLTHVEKDPFIPSRMKEQTFQDADLPAFLRRHKFRQDQETPDKK